MQIEENVTSTIRVGILLHVIHVEVGARGEIPVKVYRFPLGGGNLVRHSLEIPDNMKGRGGECMTKTSTPTALMKQTPYQ